MKHTNKILTIDENIAESINLSYYKKFDLENENNVVNYSVDLPILVSSSENIIDELIEQGKLIKPVFNNIAKNEHYYSSLYVEDSSSKHLTNRYVTEISQSYGFGFNKKVNLFTPNLPQKLKKLFIEEYSDVINKPSNYDIDLIAEQNNIPRKKVKWTFKQIRKVGVEKCVYGALDLNLNPDKEQTNFNLNMTFPNAKKLFNIVSKLLNKLVLDVKVYYNYFKRVFNDLYIEITQLKSQEKKPPVDQIEIYISYLKLLTMRIFEYYDIFKAISVDEIYINKFSILLLKIEKEIQSLERII